ncbi:MAG: hypothetical protein A3I29_01725 [Candidatus Magasanikbacteria bacterium RIFCSPLOWO2_02_FULL_44_11]|uniref:Replication-associated protein ORF2/G2P domain-containing protein n=1 Tax=Candidatus Magasanikbacteria bacterium RIFCSPLOWO2_02_FULL_44_11 TaxID=1798689 RepID=A0A1F6NBJ3_9BACT|nr:MAG: hypothetical protein A3I29_01725 [Candidatus Magasanikbacteria bacterium RIFCSPLOWO2_02_FULL_44_11]OGQ02936.1 MAG: hypothetical protein A3D19_05860 [Deltaproteobacteria bacterium RIFCSPHIGHO2_02_FULL_38_15]
MAFPYNLKVVVSGKQVEVYKYKKNIWRDFERTLPSVLKTDNNIQYDASLLQTADEQLKRQQKTQFSINRTRTEIRRLVNSNPQLTKFLTLTFAENITDLKDANYVFNQFVKRISYRYSDFEYLAVPEFQQRGAVHYHLLCNLPFIEQEAIAQMWGQGFIKINRLNNVTNVGAYVCKYLSKDMFDERTFGKKKFFRSQTLKAPVEILGWLATLFEKKYLTTSTPVYERTFQSDWTGEVNYRSYSLDSFPLVNGVLNKSQLIRPV